MPSYSELGFPSDDQYWMVTWVERVAFAENDFRFKIRLVSIIMADFLKSFYKASNYNRTYITCYIDTAQFAKQAEIGSIWHRKELFFSPSKQYKEYSGLITHTISLPQPAQTTSCSLSEIANRTQNLAGFHPFPVLRYSPLPPLLGQSTCLVVDAPYFRLDGRKDIAFVLFPPSELLRFYHCGSSTYLFRQLMRNGLAEDRIYKRRATRYNAATQELFIQLRKQIPDEDALLVGRLAGDEVAYKAARDIGRHLQQNLINSAATHLVTTFPFEGPTTLHVVGKRLKVKDNEWAFFVYAIISCSGAFPFQRLLYSRDNDNRVRTADPSPDVPLPRRQQGSSSPQLGPISSSTASPTGQSIGRQSTTTTFVLRFPQAPPFARLPKDQRPVLVPGKIPRWYTHPERTGVSSVPPSNVGKEVSPNGSRLGSLQEKAPSLAFSEFRAIMTGMIQLGLTCYCLTNWNGWAKSKQYKDFYLSRYRDLDPKERRWLTVVTGLVADKHNPERKRKLRKRRKAVVLEIVYSHATFYLVECEAGINESFSRMLIWYDQAVDISSELNTLFPVLVSNRGVWREFPFPLYATTRTLHHTAGETGLSVAKRVFSYIKQIINRYNAVPIDLSILE